MLVSTTTVRAQRIPWRENPSAVEVRQSRFITELSQIASPKAMFAALAAALAFAPTLPQCPRVAASSHALGPARAVHPVAVAALSPDELAGIGGAVLVAGGAYFYTQKKDDAAPPAPPSAAVKTARPPPPKRKGKDSWGLKGRKGFRGGINKPKPKAKPRKLWKPPRGWKVCAAGSSKERRVSVHK